MKNRKILPVILFWTLYISYTSTYILRLNLSCASSALEQIGKMSTAQLASLGGVFSMTYAIGKLLNGGIGDRVKPWIMVTVGLLLAGVGNLVVGFLPPYGAMLVCWGLNAFGQSMLWGAILRLVSSIFDEETARKRAPVMGTSIAMGNILGILLSSWLVTNWSIQTVFWIPGTLAIGLAVIVLLTGHKTVTQESKGVFPLRQLLRPEVLIMVLPAVIQGAIKDNVSLFMVDYFAKQFLLDTTLNPFYILFIPLSGLVGRMVYPMVYKWLGCNEDRASMLGFLFCALCALPLSLNLGGATVATLCLCGIYAFISIVNTSFLSMYPLHFAREGNVSSISSVMDFVIYLGHAVSTTIYGVLIVRYGYDAMYLTWVFISIAAVILLGLNTVVLRRMNSAKDAFPHINGKCNNND